MNRMSKCQKSIWRLLVPLAVLTAGAKIDCNVVAPITEDDDGDCISLCDVDDFECISLCEDD